MIGNEIWHLVVTVGTSAIYNKDIGKRLGSNKQTELKLAIERYRGSTHKKRTDNEALFKSLVQEHKDYWSLTDKTATQTSAELLSTPEILKEVRPADILLVSSDTDEGDFAAQINREALPTIVPGVKVDSLRLAGLDVGGANPFEGVFVELGRQISSRYRDETHRIAFNVTGGFKGTVLFVGALALERGWRVYYRHEDMQETMVMDLDAARKAVFRKSRR
jgi:CRISPR/Cas system-associated protein Csm6